MQTLANLVFKAIADPTRRKIIHLLSRSDCSVKELTASFSVSQPAISQHLRELRSARLVASERIGLEHRYRLTGSPLRDVVDWAEQYKRFFDPAGHAWSFTPLVKHAKSRSGRSKKGGRRHGG
jgi:DNA-binding transcriptional ArsR family regulator